MNKILIVDDILTNRFLLSQMLVALGDFEVVEAVNGKEAITLFEETHPDLILMDVNMPVMDGYESATAIKKLCGNQYTPIIFVTALSSEASLANSLDSGGDDFISKPFSAEVLESKVNVHLRIRELNLQLNHKNKILTAHNEQLSHEKELIEHFFENALKQSFLDKDVIKYHMSSMSTFNGDVFLVKRAPQGGLYLVMGDFSGHGLTAAMGTLPVALIFFKMAEAGAAVGDIARELNFELNKLLPVGMFFAATLLELNSRGDVMTVWMGGVPELYCLSKKGDLKEVIHSKHMPLGILGDSEFSLATQVFDVEIEDKIYLYSDGIIEANNPQGEQFGDARLKDILINEGDNRFDEVIIKLDQFTGEQNQNDDITLVELNCKSIPALIDAEEEVFDNNALLWNISISLSAEEMRAPNPVNKISSILSAMPHMSRHKGALHIILTEIYSNALEHSILNINSELKIDEENFVEYYNIRDEALLKLESATIDFNFSLIVNDGSYYLDMKVSDSGSGYHNKSLTNDEMLHGRGLNIIGGLCDKAFFSDDGKTLNILYKL
ncbi:MAG: SpoIIE family protein phosphatase [Gammaproteobacteria bacterium]|nr:SpoIIE family protein phosphatase [Gammaproteobacteria bacterium]